MSIKCTAMTTKGLQCSRNAAIVLPSGNGLCKAHVDKAMAVLATMDVAPIQPAAAGAAPIIPTTIIMEPLTIAEGVDSVMSRFGCTPFEALARLVKHGAITDEDATAYGMTLDVTIDPPIPTITEKTPMESEVIPTKAESPASGESPIPTLAESAPIIPPTSYTEFTHVIAQAVARVDVPLRKVKRSDHDRDVAFFDNVLRKRPDIARYVMPEYKACPIWWVPSVKLKAGETPAQRLERDYNKWLKDYAIALANRKVARIGDLFFYPAKITPGGYVAMIREGLSAYVLEYSAKIVDIFGGDPQAQIVGLIGVEVRYPLVAEMIADARSYHKARNRKERVDADISAAHVRYLASFKAAHAMLLAIDTGESDEPAVVNQKGVTA